MNRPKLFAEIKDHLEFLASSIVRSNRLNLTDDANFAEDLFARLLNAVFGYNLSNVNAEQMNADTIDLADRKKRIGVQVTANQDFAKKKRKTIDSFEKGTAHSGIKKLLILYISPKKASSKVLAKETLSAKRETEGYDIDKLLLAIKGLTPTHQQSILTVLEEELLPLKSPTLVIKVELEQLREIQPKNDAAGLQINRDRALDSFDSVCANQHAMLIGQPGVGKSYLLNAFNERVWKADGCCVLFQIDKLATGSKEELSRILRTKENWIDFLSAIDTCKNCCLVFDAYDTARGSSLNENILERIAEAIDGLPDNWNVIASVRTFDAQKSPKLKHLFTQGKHSGAKNARIFELSPLTDAELAASLETAPNLKVVFGACSDSLRKVLTIPYFLKIFEEVVSASDSAAITRLKGIATQEQLLDIYWERKVDAHEQGTAIERAAQVLAEEMFTLERLNVERRLILPKIEEASLELLRAEGIVVDIQADRLVFRHNILFDYVVARLVLAQSSNEFVAQISANPKAPFIFRPSYWILVHRLWKLEHNTFWELYHHVWAQDGITFRLLHQLVFNSTLVSSFESIDDLKPLFDAKLKARYGMYMQRFLDALRFTVREGFRKQDMELIARLSQNIRVDFVWHLGMFIRRAQEQGYKEQAAESAIRYMHYLLDERETPEANVHYLDRMAGWWGVDAITDLPFSFKLQVRQTVQRILSLLSTENFPIEYFRALVNKFILLLKADTPLAVKVFTTIYEHNETSQSPTTMGTGVVLNLTSNRRQDFDMCKYGLEHEALSEFLRLKPYEAIRATVSLTNKLKRKEWRIKSKLVPICYNSIATSFQADSTIGDWEHDRKEGVGKLLQTTIEFIENRFVSGEQDAEKLLDTFIKSARTGYVWKELLKMFTRHPKHFHSYALILLGNEILHLANETTYEAGELIKAIVPYLNNGELKSLEKRIIGLPKSPAARKDDPEFLERRVAKALSCFPGAKLNYQASKRLRVKHSGYQNRPLVTSTGLQSVVETEEERREKLGINPERKADLELDELQKELAATLESVGKAEVSKAKQRDRIATDTFHLFDKLNKTEECAKGVEEECDYVIAKGIEWISRTGKHLSKSRANRCFAICKHYLRIYGSDAPIYDLGKLNGRAVSYGSTPRRTIIHALPFLSQRSDIAGYGELLEKVLVDNDSIVRAMAMDAIGYFYMNDREAFWKWMNDRSQHETDGWCLTTMLHGLCWGKVLREESDKVDTILEAIASRITVQKLSGTDSVVEQFVVLLLSAIEINGSAVAKKILAENRTNQSLQWSAVSKMTDRIAAMLKAKNLPASEQLLLNYYSDELNHIISAQYTSLRQVGLESESSKDLFTTIDHIVQRIYFTTGAEDGNKRSRIVSDAHYQFYKPKLDRLITESNSLSGGLLLAHTGYYAAQYLELCLGIEPNAVLWQIFELVRLAKANNFAGDKQTLDIIVRIIEACLADHREVLFQANHFEGLLQTLGIFVDSGWQEALELVWKLNEVFT